jgi:mono/diheme cytochrome c family protein
VTPRWKSRLRRWLRWTLLAAAAAVVLLVIYGTWRINRDEPVVYADDAEHFKYGSTGGERGYKLQPGFGLPYWIWTALPELFPDLLPDGRAGRGYASFGMLYEPGHDPRFELPIGMSTRNYQGVDRVYFNCAVCHTGSVRGAPDAPATHVLGMPANTLDLGRLARFLFDTAADPRFTPGRVMPVVRRLAEVRDRELPANGRYRPADFDLVNRLAFKVAGVHLVRDRLLNIRGQMAFIDSLRWGPGRVDTFNAPKALLAFPMAEATPAELVGMADFPSVWFQAGREGMWLHWDGNNDRVDERNLSAAFGTGATPTTLDAEKVLRTAAWLWDQAAPPGFPEARIDAALAARGEPVYRRLCWDCHGNPRPPFEGERVGTVVAIADVATDRWRLDSYTPELAAAQNSLYAGFPRAGEEACGEPRPGESRERFEHRCYPARFSHFRKTYGYAAMPLDGLWLRAPYLHNGSVPTLADLLAPGEERPAVFYRGDDLYDFERVGFVHTAPRSGGRALFRFDTAAPGNGNRGHEGPAYGTELAAAERAALLEYLKTF